MDIAVLPALYDNYIFAAVKGTDALVIDPGEADPVLDYLGKAGLCLRAVMLTHHHADHVAGTDALRRATGCMVVGPHDSRMPSLDRVVHDDEILTIDPAFLFHIIATPGHTRSHVAFLDPRGGNLFCGDTLFVAGCGRILEGSAESMWRSLNTMAALPDETRLYCGHEYTADNLEFALSLDPDDPVVRSKARQTHQQMRRGLPSVPSVLKEEKTFNPFLRAGDPQFAKKIGMEDQSPVEVFTEIRLRKDRW